MKPRDRAVEKNRRPAGAKPASRPGSAAKRMPATKKVASSAKRVTPPKPAAKKAAPAKKPEARKIVAPAVKPAAVVAPPRPVAAPAATAARPAAVAPRPASAPGGAPAPTAAGPRPAIAKPAGEGTARTPTSQQMEERRKAATRKLFARLRSLEAIVGADLRKRGSLMLSQAVDQWYAEAINAAASDVTITNAARAVISQL